MTRIHRDICEHQWMEILYSKNSPITAYQCRLCSLIAPACDTYQEPFEWVREGMKRKKSDGKKEA